MTAALASLNSPSITWTEKHQKETDLFQVLNPIAERLAPLLPPLSKEHSPTAYTRDRFLEQIRIIRVRQTVVHSEILNRLTQVKAKVLSVSSDDQRRLVLTCAADWTSRDVASYRTESETARIVEQSRKDQEWSQDRQRQIAGMRATTKYTREAKEKAQLAYQREMNDRRQALGALTKEIDSAAVERKKVIENVDIKAFVSQAVLDGSGLSAAELAKSRLLSLTGRIVDFSLRPGIFDIKEPSGVSAVVLECDAVAR